MCTYHQSQLKKAQRRSGIREERFSEMVEVLGEHGGDGIAPKDRVPVLTAGDRVIPMSWGFRRQFARKDGKGLTAPKPVVNAQSERMHVSMWRESYGNRRCIVPVTAFYEWTGPSGAKVTHRFHQEGDAFFVAGLWEDHPEHGLCHTMLTTEPNREVAATGHDRCLVVLLEDEISRWLAGGEFGSFRRPDGILAVESGVANPRARAGPANRPEQGELF